MVPKGWDKKKLSDMALINPTKTKKINNDDYVTFFAMSDISEEGRVLNYNIRKYKEVCVGYTPFEDGDILIAKITPCFENGKGALVTNLKNGVGFGSTEFHVLRPLKDKTYPKFLFQFTKSRFFRRLGEVNMVGTAGQKRVPTNFLTSTKYIFPPLPEQRKISVFLFTWDKALENTTKLLAAKKKLKQGLMQQLLTGKRRFKEFKDLAWKKRELREFLTPVTRSISKPDTEYTALGIRSHGKGTFLKKIENHKDIMMDTLYEVRKDDLIVNITFAWEGAIAIVKKTDEGALVSHRFPTYVFDRSKVTPDFFRHVILTKKFVHLLGLISPGGAGRNRVLSKSDFLTLGVSIPPLEEQTKIAGILDALDREINTLEIMFKAIQNQKIGLMQKLLTGQIRVRV